MTQNETQDFLNYDDSGKAVLPSGLNVLTILTFIGSGFILLFCMAMPWWLNFSKEMIDKAQKSGTELSPKQMEDFAKAKTMIALQEANMVPTIVIGIIAAILCIVGAVWMRKLKKDGYWIYVAGQVVPIIASFILVGVSQYQDWKSYLGLAIPLLFIILYTTQRKYLIK